MSNIQYYSTKALNREEQEGYFAELFFVTMAVILVEEVC